MEFSLENLNSQQKEAVLETAGPLLIIAGAGTGKTHVLISKILHLLLNQKIGANKVLALTFTDKSAQEMQDRVDKILPLSFGQIAIQTFHGFCENLLRESGIEIGLDPSFKILNQSEQWIFLSKNLFVLNMKYYRPLGNPNKFFSFILSHFSRLKDEDISPQEYLSFAQQLHQQATDKIQTERAEKIMEIANAYEIYQQLMIKNSSLDFGDLHYYCLRLLEKHPSLLAEYQEKFQFILVDEFQDTNYAQNKLINFLSGKHKNVTVVGDDDQSIYKWRGASLSNILNFEQTFSTAKKTVLTENYRSSQNILDLSYAVIQNNNPYRLEVQQKINKKLHAQSGAGKPVEIWHFSGYFEESLTIAKKIHQDVEKSGGSLHYRDFAILVRTNRLVKPFIEALDDLGIPFSIKGGGGLLHLDEIKDLIAVLRFLKNPYDDVAFFRLLTFDIFALKMSDILEVVSKAKRAGHEPLFKYLRLILTKNSVQDTLPGLEDQPPFQTVYDFFNSLLEFSKSESVTRILGEFLNTSGYYKNLLAHESVQNNEKIEHLAQFLEIAKNFELENNERSGSAFMEYVELMDESEGITTPLLSDPQDAVSVITFHAAKGLEFETVFIPNLVNQRFPTIHRREVFEIPAELIKEELPSSDQHLAEERRLFYVGCTRAKSDLILSYSDFYEGSKRWKLSVFLEEARLNGQALEKDFTKLGNLFPNELRSSLSVNPKMDNPKNETLQTIDAKEVKPTTSGVQKATLKNDRLLYVPVSKISQLSYSQLDTFATCPLKYKFRYLFKIHSPTGHAANFGSSLHNTLNLFYQNLKQGTSASKQLLLAFYEESWIPAGYENKAHEQARKVQGQAILEKFYEKEIQSSSRLPAYLERNFRLKIGRFIFNGRIDRIDKLQDGTYEVIDYKSGSSKRDLNLKNDLQLSLYALACKEIFRIPVSKLSLYFLEDLNKLSTSRGNSDLYKTKQELQKLSSELVESDFLPTPGFHCRFCEFRVLCYAAE